jgi:hypothetical protein
MTTRTRIVWLVFLAVVGGLGALMAQAQKKPAAANPAQKKPAIAYPAYPNDPRHWRHVKTMVIYSRDNPLFDRFQGLHNVYVNDLGWPAFRSGKLFPDGSMLALELYGTSNSPGAIEGRGLKATFLMKKNAKLYADTGGWGFEVFEGNDQKPTLTDMKPCWDCHKVGKSRDYVKSEYMQ